MTDTSTTTQPGAAPTAAPVAPAPQAAPVPTPPPAGAPVPATPAAPAAPASSDPATWPAEARAEVERLRRENGDARITAKNNAREEGLQTAVRALASAAGIDLPGSEPATLEQVQAALQTMTTERDSASTATADAQRDRDLILAAWQAGVHPGKVDYLRFLAGQNDTYRGLDPKGADYGATLSSTVAAIVAADQTLKGPGATTASGASEYGGAGEQAITQEQFNAMPIDKRQALYHSDRATYDRLAAGQYGTAAQ